MKEILFFILIFLELLCLSYIIIAYFYPRYRFWPAKTHKPIRNYVLMFWSYLFLIAVVFLSILDSGRILFPAKGISAVGMVMFVTGLGLYIWCCLHLNKKQQFGFKDRLIVSGPYRYVRNPGYIADMLIFTGYALLCNSPYVFVILVVFSLVILLFPLIEEPWLSEQYGEDYVKYYNGVPRYIPRLF